MDDEMVAATVVSIGPIRYTYCEIDAWRTEFNGHGYPSREFILWLHFKRRWRWGAAQVEIPKQQAVKKMYGERWYDWGRPVQDYEPVK